MKNIFQRPIAKKLLYIFTGLFLFLILLNYVLLPFYVYSPEVKVPKVVKLDIKTAVRYLEDQGLEPIITDTTYDSRFKEGEVIIQKPKDGSVVKKGRRIHLIVSGGEKSVEVPQLKGKSVGEAKNALEVVGLKLGSIDTVFSSQAKGIVIAQQYEYASRVKSGQRINVTVSRGSLVPGDVELPNLIGMQFDSAKAVIERLKLNVGKITFVPAFDFLPNTVSEQTPSPGSKVDEGSKVELFVTKIMDVKDEVKTK